MSRVILGSVLCSNSTDLDPTVASLHPKTDGLYHTAVFTVRVYHMVAGVHFQYNHTNLNCDTLFLVLWVLVFNCFSHLAPEIYIYI